MKKLLLSDNGGDRATAYAMSNKIVSLEQGCLCTWMNSECRNQWALVDLDGGCIRHNGFLGEQCKDNHCGAALATADGKVHAITGAHHGSFQHYQMNPAAVEKGWQHVSVIEARGTYPSLVADSRGRLHLVFRATSGEYWTLDYCRFERGRWIKPQALVVAEKPGYVYWTNGLTVGPDDRLHLVFGNTRVMAGDALYYGASHIYSDSGGKCWRTSAGEEIITPSAVAAVPMIMGDGDGNRLQTVNDQEKYQEPGPANNNYRQMLLSNPVVDPQGEVHVIIHNGLNGQAELWNGSVKNKWVAKPLTEFALAGESGKCIHMQSSLSLDSGGQPRAALMIAPGDECVWGPAGTYLIILRPDRQGEMKIIDCVSAFDSCRANWLPAFEHPRGMHILHQEPPLLYTSGRNAGGFSQNVNRLRTEVYLCRGDKAQVDEKEYHLNR